MENIDLTIFFFLHNLPRNLGIGDDYVIFFAHYVAFILIAVLIFYLLTRRGTLTDKLLTGFVILLGGYLSRYGVGTPIRYVSERSRPFLTHDINELFIVNSYSFPSGHSTFFFGISTVVYCFNKQLGIFFYIATICMTTARVMAGVHYPSDIIAGAIIGIIVGKLTHKYLYPTLKKYFNIEN